MPYSRREALRALTNNRMESRPRRRIPRDRGRKTEYLAIIIPILIIVLIYFLLAVTELDSYINTGYGIQGFGYIWPIPSGISLKSDGNLTMRFMNLWMARVTILNITVENNESGRCYIHPDQEIIYRNKTRSLPAIIPAWERFDVKAFDCAPEDVEITKGDKFQVEMKTKYILGEVFNMKGIDDITHRIFMRGMTVHDESGRVRGDYEVVHEGWY